MELRVYEKQIDREISEFLNSGITDIFCYNNFELNQEILGMEEKKFSSKDEAYHYFEKLFKESVCRLEEKLSKYNTKSVIENLMMYLSPLTKLSVMSLNGKIDVPQDLTRTFPRIRSELRKYKNEKIRLTNLKIFLGRKKRLIDIIINVCLVKLDVNSEYSTGLKISPYEIYEILYAADEVLVLHNIFQRISKENKEKFTDGIIYIGKGKLHYPDFHDYGLNIFANTALKEYGYSEKKEEEIKKIRKLYEEELGFSFNKIINTFSPLFFKNNRLNEGLFYRKRDELKKLINLAKDTVPLKGLLLLLDTNMCLEYKKQEKYSFIFNNDEKISAKGILKIGNQYIFSFSTISSYALKVCDDILNQDFLRKNGISNPKIAKYLATQYSEWWLRDIKSKMNKEGIWFDIQIGHFEKYFKFPQEKGITKEIDFVFFDEYSKTLLLGEYKNWQDVSFNFMDVHKEQERIQKVIKSHEKLISILSSDIEKLLEMLGIHRYINNIGEVSLKLINVFENRNISSNQHIFNDDNQNRNIENFSKQEFEEYVENHKNYFLKIEKSKL